MNLSVGETIAAAGRAEASIGTVASAVPWMISVGTVKAGRSGRKSVVAKAWAQASVGFSPAIIAVPTAVTGFYGQNVPYPGAGETSGFVVSSVLVVGGAAALWLAFRRRDWL